MKINRLFLLTAGLAALVIGSNIAWQRTLESRSITNVRADGMSSYVPCSGMTVKGVLEYCDITPRKQDIVTPAALEPAPPGGLIRVVRIDESVEHARTDLPPKVVRRTSLRGNLREVELQKVEQKRSYRTVKTSYRDGRLTNRDVVRELVLSKTSYFLNLLDQDGSTEKIYDLSKCRRMKMTATAYYPGDPLAWGDGTVTYLGLRMQRGIVAVDPRVILLRTRVFIPGYGYGFAGDTGSSIKGKRIDLGVNNRREETSWIYEPVSVYILEKNQSW